MTEPPKFEIHFGANRRVSGQGVLGIVAAVVVVMMLLLFFLFLYRF